MSLAWRPPIRSDRQVAALWAVSAAGSLALRPLWFGAAGLFPPCMWHQWTGLPCPGCGTTRAILLLLHGDAVAGFAQNPLAACAASAFVVAGLASPVWLAVGGLLPVLDSRPRPGWLVAGAVAMIANWVWLYASGV